MPLKASSSQNNNINSSLIFSALTALFIIGLVASMNEWLAQSSFAEQTQQANIINIAGRQRMLSQNLVKHVLLIEKLILKQDNSVTKTILINELNELLKEFTDTHLMLSEQVKQTDLAVKNSTTTLNLYAELSPIFIHLSQTIGSITKETSAELLSQKLPYILKDEKDFLNIMDKIVAQYAEEAEERTSKVKLNSLVLYLFLLLVLWLTWLLITKPRIAQITSLLAQIKEHEDALMVSNQKLQETLEKLDKTQLEILEAEKNTILTSAVGGIAHDISTPLGICLTASSVLEDNTLKYQKQLNEGKLTKSNLENFFQMEIESIHCISKNVERAIELIYSFKNIAIDQGTQEKRTINLRSYCEDILRALGPKLKPSPHQISLSCPDDLTVLTYPSAYYQIITNLVMNSLIHAFPNNMAGKMSIEITADEEFITLVYSDNGVGFSESIRKKIFDVFFTTKKNKGGSGLGTHIVYRLVTEDLEGKIICQSEIDLGTKFILTLPITLTNLNLE